MNIAMYDIALLTLCYLHKYITSEIQHDLLLLCPLSKWVLLLPLLLLLWFLLLLLPRLLLLCCRRHCCCCAAAAAATAAAAAVLLPLLVLLLLLLLDARACPALGPLWQLLHTAGAKRWEMPCHSVPVPLSVSHYTFLPVASSFQGCKQRRSGRFTAPKYAINSLFFV